MVVKRFTVALVNILFPPLAVYMLCGLGHDFALNSALFLLAVIPSHIHGFYLSWTYFNRKRKVRKGLYPGSSRPMIHSEKVLNGGATSSEVRKLKKSKDAPKEVKARDVEEEKRPGRVRRLFRRASSHVMPSELVPSYAASEEPTIQRHRSTRRRSSHRGHDDRRLSRSKEVYDNGFQYSPTETDLSIEQQPDLPLRHKTQDLVPRHSLQGDQISRSRAVAGRSTVAKQESRQMEERPPVLPRRTYRSDIDGWLVRVEPGETM